MPTEFNAGREKKNKEDSLRAGLSDMNKRWSPRDLLKRGRGCQRGMGGSPALERGGKGGGNTPSRYGKDVTVGRKRGDIHPFGRRTQERSGIVKERYTLGTELKHKRKSRRDRFEGGPHEKQLMKNHGESDHQKDGKAWVQNRKKLTTCRDPIKNLTI